MINYDEMDLTNLPLLPREGGRKWPDNRGWTPSEVLELRELQLRQVLKERDELQRLRNADHTCFRAEHRDRQRWEGRARHLGTALRELAEFCRTQDALQSPRLWFRTLT